jgi:hypothetical protein
MKRAKVRHSKVKKALPKASPAETSDGELLAFWLNGDGWGNTVEDQQRLKSLLTELSNVREKSRGGMEIGESDLKPVNELLNQYPWILQVYSSHPSPTANRSLLSFLPRPAGRRDQGHAWLSMLVELMSSGLLDRLRMCATCGYWFYARLPKAQYHSAACRQAHFRALPTYQGKNKTYQAQHYREHYSPNKKYYRQGLSPTEVRELKRKAKQRRRSV